MRVLKTTYRWSKSGPLRLRTGQRRDAFAAWMLFYDAVHDGTARHYTARERTAWAPSRQAPDNWDKTFLRGTCIVAESLGGRLLGFMTLGEDGYLDLAYVAPKAMGRGVAGALYDRIEKQALSDGLAMLSTEASHLARSFFLRRGWHQDARQDVIRNGVALTNFRMSRALNP